MSYLALARKYRPQTFDELAGQEFAATSLKNAVSLGRVHHAYLFTGPRGCGKTSTARILAKALNCGHLERANPCNRCESCIEINEGISIDVVEIDAASRGSVESARVLNDNVAFLPMKSKRKVYIIDESHMLTTQASNALLKTLEEPPPFVCFIFATTESHKVLPTIKSRCQRYDFKKINYQDMRSTLIKVYESEKISCDADALNLIIRSSDGSMRDALSISDQLIAYSGGNITQEAAVAILGGGNDTVILELFRAVVNEKEDMLGELIASLSSSGASYHYAAEKLLEHARNLLLLSKGAQQFKNLFTKDERSYYDEIVASEHRLFALFQLFSKLCSDLRYTPYAGYTFEFSIYKAAALSRIIPLPAELPPAPTAFQKPTVAGETLRLPSESPQTSMAASVSEPTPPAIPFTKEESILDKIIKGISARDKGVAAVLPHATLNISEGYYIFNFAEKNAFNYNRFKQEENIKSVEEVIRGFDEEVKGIKITFGGAEIKNLAEKREEADALIQEQIIREAAATPLVGGVLKLFGLTEKDITVNRENENGEIL
ncbi:MAG: DNA polymerase III subunit gamma/tau [Deferribacteraceae bacterium]|jgi:DNA polymerase-3 subunit gamma/tau|nr:DNA polymerase III subunit gamma/tau [Deferribacteraceae bacterium]